MSIKCSNTAFDMADIFILDLFFQVFPWSHSQLVNKSLIRVPQETRQVYASSKVAFSQDPESATHTCII